MSFPNPPVPNQEHTHSNGITYIFSDTKKAWEIKYEAATNTASLPLVSPTSRYLPSAGASLPDSGGLLTQSDYNQWAFNSLVKVDETSRVDSGESAPGDADTNQLWYKPSTGSLYVYYNDGGSTQWVEIGGGGGPSNTYRIETDPHSGHPQIQLLDQDDNFSNVKFTASGDLTVLSTSAKIEYGVDLSGHATKAYVDLADDWLQEQIDHGVEHQTEIEQEQVVQNNQINALEVQIQQLAKVQASGKWRFERNVANGPRPPANGTFYGTHKDDVSTVLTDWSDLRLIMVDKTDLDGNVYTFSAFEEGDKIEILATDGSNSVFGTVTNDPQQESYGNMIVTVERSHGGPAEGTEYVLSVYRPGAGNDVDLDILDTRYVVKTGDTMTGSLHIEDDLTIDGNTYFTTKAPDFQHGAWFQGTLAINADTKGVKFYKDDKSGVYGETRRYLDSGSGDVTVKNEMYLDTTWSLDVKNADNSVDKNLITANFSDGLSINDGLSITGDSHSKPLFALEPSDSGQSSVLFVVKDQAGGEILEVQNNGQVFYERTADADAELTNKGYVDTAIQNSFEGIDFDGSYLPISGGVLTGNLVLGTGSGLYSQEIIKSVRNTGYALQVRPDDGVETCHIHTNGNAEFAQVKVHAAPVAGADLTNKSYTDSTFRKKIDRPGLKFGYESGGSGVPTSGKFRWYVDSTRRLRLSATTKDGIPWAVDTPIADINFSEGHMFSIWATVSNSDNWRLKQTGTIDRIDYHANDVLLYVSYHAENGTFSTSAEYNITVAGLI